MNAFVLIRSKFTVLQYQYELFTDLHLLYCRDVITLFQNLEQSAANQDLNAQTQCYGGRKHSINCLVELYIYTIYILGFSILFF